MAAELITPTDPLSGIPLCWRPTEILPSDNPELANRHHVWHPSTAPELNVSTLAGAALRRSRLLIVPANQHNYRDPKTGSWTYHDYYRGPVLPQTEEEIFNILVPSVAGYIPAEAIDMSKGEPRKVRLNQDEIDILRTPAKPQPIDERKLIRLRIDAGKAYDQQIEPNVTREAFAKQFVQDYVDQQMARAGFHFHHMTYGYREVRDFFTQYIKDQDLSHVDEIMIEEFLTTVVDERRKFLGQKLLSKAVEVATDDINVRYFEFRKRGALHPRMPRSARELVKFKIGNTERREVVAAAIGEQLKEQYGLAA